MILAVVALLLALGTADARAAAMGSRPVDRFAPRFTRLAGSASVYAAGDYRLLGPEQGITRPGGDRVLDVVTRHTLVIHPPPGESCPIDALGPTALVLSCQQGPAPVLIYHLKTGTASSYTNLPGFPAQVGSRWLALATVDGPFMEYNAFSISYFNLLNGRIVPDPRQIGKAAYPDLDSDRLVHTACSPIHVRSELDDGRFRAPQDLRFFGNVAVQTNQDNGITTIQRCGSHAITRLRTGSPAFGHHLILWARRDSLRGVLEPEGQRISIALPSALNLPTEIALNNQDVYVQAHGAEVWAARLPASLR